MARQQDETSTRCVVRRFSAGKPADQKESGGGAAGGEREERAQWRRWR